MLIAIEGIDGAGKTTQAKRLEELLSEPDRPVVRSKEPTDGQWGKKLRASATMGRLSMKEELDLFLKDRREHVETVINPALAAGKVVIVDRYYYSTIAYQGARGMDPAKLQAMNEEFAPIPDIVFLLDVEPEVGLARIEKRGDGAGNHFENLKNLEAVSRIFRQLSGHNIVRLPGNGNPDDVTHVMLERLYEGPLTLRRPPGDAVPLLINDQVWTASSLMPTMVK